MSAAACVFVCHRVNVRDEAERQALLVLLAGSYPAATQKETQNQQERCSGVCHMQQEEARFTSRVRFGNLGLLNKSHMLFYICTEAEDRTDALIMC